MPRLLRNIYSVPFSGFPDRPWRDHPDEDAFAKTARRVCEVLCDGLAREEISARVGRLRVSGTAIDTGPDARLSITEQRFEGEEWAHVGLPPGIASLSPQVRARFVFEVVRAAALRFAELRGFDPAGLERAFAHTLAQEFNYGAESAWKASPDRRLRARLVHRLDDDGYGRTRVEVRRLDDELVGYSEEFRAFSTAKGLRRSNRTIRWVGSEAITFVPDYGPFGLYGPNTLVAVADLGHPEFSRYHGIAEGESWPAIRLNASDVYVDGKTPNPRVGLSGGGPTNYAELYFWALHVMSKQFRETGWEPWWAPADRNELDVYFTNSPGSEVKIFLRRGKTDVKGTVDRGRDTFDGGDLIRLAWEDVAAVLAVAARRMGLPPAPMPELDAVREEASQLPPWMTVESPEVTRVSLLELLQQRVDEGTLHPDVPAEIAKKLAAPHPDHR